MITWGASDTRALVDGSQDAYLRRQARSVAAIGGTVFLRFFHEMEGGYRASIVHSPAEFVTAWRHVHALFEAEGATNVVWVWCPTAWSFTATSNPTAYYPGHDVVDWVAADGYNWAPVQPGSRWRSFTEVFTRFYAWGITTGKPLMIAEFGVQEDPAQPERKAQWIRDALVGLRETFPLIQGAVYFDTTHVKPEYSLVWNLNSSERATAAWVQIGQDPYLAARPVAAAAGPGLPGPYEFVTNPGFEFDLGGWAGRLGAGAAAVTRDSTRARSGVAALRLDNTSLVTATVGVSDSPTWVVGTVAGRAYTASVWVSGNRPGQVVQLRLREVRGSTVLSSRSVSTTITVAGGWQRLSVNLTPTRDDSTTSMAVLGSLRAGDLVWVDDASLVGG